MPIWAFFVAHFGYNFGYYVLLIEIPTYLHNMLRIPVSMVVVNDHQLFKYSDLFLLEWIHHCLALLD